jgi:hypothetical protein
MADVAADPRIRDALEVSSEELAKAAEEVRNYLANAEQI